MIENHLPDWSAAWQDRLRPALAWDAERFASLEEWQCTARARLEELASVPCTDGLPLDLQVEEESDRGTYVRRKVSFAGSRAWRVPAYLLLPKGEGPFPAVVALHDHGAFFYWGKEKVVETDALERPGLRQFVETAYGGRPFGDELARRGYAVLATDGFFWGERRVAGAEARSGGRVPWSVEETRRCNQFLYEQQSLAAMNLMQLGLTWQGVLINDDLRSAEALASLPQVDARRIASCGLSVGCYRAWTLAALSDRIRACVGICWMATQESLMRQPNNQNRSQSAYSMLIPGMRRWLEIPDVASLACPRPLLLYAGRQDELFPPQGVDDAFARISAVYRAHGHPERFVGQWWDRPHCFDRSMQDAAFAWLAEALQE